MITLVLEASTYEGSVALLRDGDLLGERTVAMRGREHEALMPAVAAVLAACGLQVGNVERVACGAGPGAFTSLRIAGAIAKGLALAVGADLVSVSSLALLVASREPYEAGRYVAAVDAMRGEHYVQTFEVDRLGVLRSDGGLGLVPSASVNEFAREHGAQPVGPEQPSPMDVRPHARAAARITNLLELSARADLAAWEPGYGRLAEAQVKWEAAHGRPLNAG